MPPSTTKLLCWAGAFVVVPTCVWLKKERIRDYASFLCEGLSSAPDICSDVSRDAFAQTSVPPAGRVQGHTHASAAGLRSSATTFTLNLAQFCGAEVFVVGMSRSDQRKGLRGTRQWWWTKDTNASNRMDEPGPQDVRYMCDVDYYVDMPHCLASEPKPTVLYTVVPEEATSHGEDDTAFYFEADASLTTLVSGGGRYNHHLWDYSADSFLVVQRCFGMPVRAVAYAVERKQVGKHRQLILLAPIKVFDGIACWMALALLETKPLKRFDPVLSANGEVYVRYSVVKSDGDVMVTTARPCSLLCATVPAADDDAIATVARLGTTNLMLPTTASWVKNRSAAAVLTEYHRKCGLKPRMVVYPVEQGVRAYQYEPLQFDADAKPKLQAFMSPLVHGAFAPVANDAGERRCVEGRINSLKKPEPKPSNFRDRCIDEFADLIVQGMILEPVCVDVVQDKQTSTSQRLSIMKAVLTGHFRKAVLKCFIKAEAYPDVKDPRNISTYNDADKLDMARFALSLARHLKQFPWYGPGKTPLEIANRVTEVCMGSSYVNISDYHRMDGTISYVLRQVERAVCMKAFANHGAVLSELLRNNVDNVGYLPHGTAFDQGSSHGSGCSATSVFQTLRAAFNSYLAYRHAKRAGGRGLSPGEAFAALGIHLGDDGVDGDLPVSSHQWASGLTGLILEAYIVPRGDRGVNFLARYYSQDVWEGLPDSMCDLKRQLSKFHTTVRLPSGITPEQKLVEKAMSYVATDGNSPVIGEFCKKLLLLSTYRPKRLLGVGSWWSRFDASVQYPNRNVGGWMDVELDSQFPEFDRSQFNEWMATVTTSKGMLSAPLCAEPKPPTPAVVEVVVEEEIVNARSNSDKPENSDSKEQQRTIQSERKERPKRKTRTRPRRARKELTHE